MMKRNFSLAIGLAVAFLAMQTPYLAQANGGGSGEQEVIDYPVFPSHHHERQSLRVSAPVRNQAIMSDKAKTSGRMGLFGRFFKKNRPLSLQS